MSSPSLAREYPLLCLTIADSQQVINNEPLLLKQVEACLRGGVDMVIVQDAPHNAEMDYVRVAKELSSLCHKYNVPLLLKDHVNEVGEVGADGVEQDFSSPTSMHRTVAAVRTVCRKGLVGAIVPLSVEPIFPSTLTSQHDLDYVSIGPVFPQSTHNLSGQEVADNEYVALRKLASAAKMYGSAMSARIATFGGLNRRNISSAIRCGVDIVCVTTELLESNDPFAAARGLKKKMNAAARARNPRRGFPASSKL